ncbi:MAG: SufE family protein [Pseudomonadota bacterium]
MEDPKQATPPSGETLADVQRSIVANFQYLQDWNDRYQLLIDLGRRLPHFPPSKQTDDNRLYGCQSAVWLDASYSDGKLEFLGISDSAIVAGLVALLLKVYSGRRPEEILATPPSFIAQIGLSEHLSPHRANGLALMLGRIREIALAHVSGSEGESAP